MSHSIGAAAALIFGAAAAFAQDRLAAQQIQEHSAKARQYLQVKQPDLAMGEFQAILAIDPQNLDAQVNLGVLQYFDGKYGDAVAHLRAVLKANPNLWKIEALLGMSEKRLGDNKQSQADLARAFPHLEEQKLLLEAGLELIEVDYSLNDLAKAAEVANVLRQNAPSNPDVLYAAHRVYADLSDETLLSLAMVAPNTARMHQIMAHELARQAKDEEAIAQYRLALQLDPQRADIHYELAELLNAQASKALREEAAKEFQTALDENPFDEKSLCRLGDFAVRNSDQKRAIDYYSRALQLQPDDAMANVGLAKVYMFMQEPLKAEPLLKQAVQIEPFDPIAHYRLSAVYRELGRSEDAQRELAEFEKLKKMKSDLSDIYRHMRLTAGGSDISEAETSGQTGTAHEPN